MESQSRIRRPLRGGAQKYELSLRHFRFVCGGMQGSQQRSHQPQPQQRRNYSSNKALSADPPKLASTKLALLVNKSGPTRHHSAPLGSTWSGSAGMTRV